MTHAAPRPILVIGPHRSGTTLLGRALGHHPEVAYWEEPRHVWTWGHNYRSHDRLGAEDATPRIKAHIRQAFARRMAAEGKEWLAEKTPSNCLRLPFIREIFPQARYLYIFRDGRAVVHSTDIVTRTQAPEARWYATRFLGTPLWEWPAFLPRAWRTLGRRLLGRNMVFWGPRPPGWQEWLREDDHLTILAKQWRHTIEPVLDFRDQMPPESCLEIRYEELVSDPSRLAREIEAFAELTPSRAFVEHLEAECHDGRVDAWRQRMDDAELAAIRPILGPALERLGYDW